MVIEASVCVEKKNHTLIRLQKSVFISIGINKNTKENESPPQAGNLVACVHL